MDIRAPSPRPGYAIAPHRRACARSGTIDHRLTCADRARARAATL